MNQTIEINTKWGPLIIETDHGGNARIVESLEQDSFASDLIQTFVLLLVSKGKYDPQHISKCIEESLEYSNNLY